MSKKYYITTPIYYVNDKPHIGHAYTSVATDCIARFKRMDGFEVRFQTGTDEHGLKIQKAAEKKDIEPIELCNINSENFRNLTKLLNLSNNDFIRTTEHRHKSGAIYLWDKLYENNEIYEGEYKGWYSVSEETFYNEKDLHKTSDGLFKTHAGASVEWISEKSYFFRLSKWANNLLELYDRNPEFIRPKTRLKEVISFVKSGLNDLSVSRTSFDWGIATPTNEKHIMYVWLDALTCYPNGVDYLSNEKTDKAEFWKNTTHIVGKDILRHHAVYWPAFLMAANLSLPKRIFAHGWWTNEGNKISKSLGNAIDPLEIIKNYGLDQFRYFMLREVPFGNDGDFSLLALKNRINDDLVNDLGNLCQRSLSMIVKNLDGVIPSIEELSKSEETLLNKYEILVSECSQLIDEQLIHEYIKKIWKYINEINKYFNDKKPWEALKNDHKKFSNIIAISAELVKRVGLLINPIMPESSFKLLRILNVNNEELLFSNHKKYKIEGTKIEEIKYLFTRLP